MPHQRLTQGAVPLSGQGWSSILCFAARDAPPSDDPESLSAPTESLLPVGDVVSLRRLQRRLFGPREVAVVVLTSCPQTGEPALSPEWVRAIVGGQAEVYLLSDPVLLDRLNEALGRSLAVGGGDVRIYWPGLTASSAPVDHPLLAGVVDQQAAVALREFEREFHLSRPLVREEIEQIEDVRALAEERLEGVRRRLEEVEERLRDSQIQSHRESGRAAEAEEWLRALGAQVVGMSGEECLHTLIAREWRAVLTAQERREHPLGAYVLAPELLAGIARESDVLELRLAWACAMVACGYGPAVAELAPRQGERRVGAQVAAPEPWRCELGQGRELRYEVRSEGTIVFSGIGVEKLVEG